MTTCSQFDRGVTPADLDKLRSWNSTRTDYPREACIHELFEEHAARTPDAVALEFRDRPMTYGELNRRSNQLAHALRGMGVGPEAMVGILLERSLEMIVAILGVLKAGGAYVPLDAKYPVERLKFMAEDTAVSVAVAQKELLASVGGTIGHAKIVLLDEAGDGLTRESGENLGSTGNARNLAYVMYTSGSTGRPKAVLVEHRSVVRLVKKTNYAKFDAEETFLQFSPISFDASTLEIWAPLLNGGRLVIMPPESQSLSDIAEAIYRCGVTSMWLTAGLFNLMVEQNLDGFRPLRQLLIGGEALSPSHVRKALAALPDCRIINGYGPTEGTTFTCCHAITLADTAGNSIPLGRPISNTQVYVLNSEMQPVPIGEEGELFIGGDGVARGYLNRPELTAEKFPPNPYLQDRREAQGEKLYRSGDMARYRPDGAIEFLGRCDQQVKIHGHRIELGEIEAALMQHPSVNSAVVVARQDAHAGKEKSEKKLVAYIVAGRQGCPVGEVRELLRKKLPGFMLPSAIMLLDRLPLSSNGKVDRNALPAPDSSASAATVAVESAPWKSQNVDLEQTVSQIWQRVLGVKQISPQQNFFDAGGDSLQLLEAHAELQRALGSDLPITDLFEFASVAALVEHLQKRSATQDDQGLRKAQQRAQQQQAVWARQKQIQSVRQS